MKFDFPTPTDGKEHLYCLTCKSDGTKKTRQNGKTIFVCPSGHTNDRVLWWGGVKFWIAEDGELMHESVGVFVRNSQNKILFVERTEYPFGLAIPAGHVDENETAEEAAKRELGEETGIEAPNLTPLFTADIKDSCSGGCDIHQWNLYGVDLGDQKLKINDEGRNPSWLTVDEAKLKQSPPLIAHVLNDYADVIEKWRTAPPQVTKS